MTAPYGTPLAPEGATVPTGVIPAQPGPVDTPVPMEAAGPVRVNLLPPEVAEKAALRKVQAACLAAVVAAGAVVGGLYVQSGSGRSAAQAQLDAAQATHARLQRQYVKLAPARLAQAKLQSTTRSLVTAMGSDITWSRYLDEFRLRLPDHVRLTTVTAVPVAAASGPTAVRPTTTSGAGGASLTVPGALANLTISGKAASHALVADWLDQLAAIPGVTGVYLSSTAPDTTDSGLLLFTITASVDSGALSHRYDRLGS